MATATAAQISRTACGRTAWTLQHRFLIPICIRIYTGYFRYRTGHSRDACSRRGSQGVVRRDTSADFIKTRDLLLSSEIYGNTLMAEPYLPGQEITISVFADGTSLPIVERFAQKDGVAPYNGDVPVTQNSRTVIEKAAGSYNYYM